MLIAAFFAILIDAMGYPRYKPGSHMPTTQDLSAETRKKLRSKRSRAMLLNMAKLVPTLKHLGFILLTISLLYVAINKLNYLFFKTSYFELKEFEVVGHELFTREDIIKSAGLAPAMNIFSINREQGALNLQKNPYIKSANLEFEGMYKLKIAIEERKASFYVKVGIAFYEISEDGVVLSTEGMGEKDIPIITGLDLRNVRQGDSLLSNDGFYIARRWLNNLDKSLLNKISEINFSSTQNPYIILLSGVKVYPKNVEDFKKRFDFLYGLLDNLRENKVKPFYLDMRGDHIVVRPKKG